MTDTTVVTPPAAAQDPAEVARLLAVAEAGVPPVVEPAPELILGKFKTVADLEKSYTELEKKLGKPADPVVPVVEPVADPPAEGDDPLKIGDPPADEVPAGLDVEKYNADFQANGTLSDENFAEIEKAGIPRATIDNYLAGLSAMKDVAQTQVYGLVGGKENYGSMIEWARGNLSAAEISAFDGAVGGSDAQRSMAINGLSARFKADSENGLIGGRGANTGVIPFASTAEMTEAMQDKRYRNDPVYIKSVEARVHAMPNL